MYCLKYLLGNVIDIDVLIMLHRNLIRFSLLLYYLPTYYYYYYYQLLTLYYNVGSLVLFPFLLAVT